QLQSLLSPGLYLAGELLHVDGRCGGYNLQWAWASGHIAGEAACAGNKKDRGCKEKC
ncbi:MAG: NAD(P)/FAD-dependent oxidoreductase, partial [Acetatifactor sp.]|nr:NAD(P)/FAD-dependent oxidoreductase [Acetatifactor sp.]